MDAPLRDLTIRLEALSEVRKALNAHWLQEIRCDHEAQRDVTFCYCGWRSFSYDSVGKAVDAWAEHVSQTLLEPSTAALPDEREAILEEAVATVDITFDMFKRILDEADKVVLPENKIFMQGKREMLGIRNSLKDAIRALKQVRPEVAGDTLTKNTAYDFVELPHHLQTMIGRQMDFAPQLEGESDVDCYARWFRNARERGVLDKIRDFISEAVKVTGREPRTPSSRRIGGEKEKR